MTSKQDAIEALDLLRHTAHDPSAYFNDGKDHREDIKKALDTIEAALSEEQEPSAGVDECTISEYIDISLASFLSAYGDIPAQMSVKDAVGRKELQVIMDRLDVLIDMGNQAKKALPSQPDIMEVFERKYKIGDRVTKTKGSNWTGKIVGYYSTELTPIGYCIESETEKGSVQIYPEAAIKVALGKGGE